MIQDPLSLYLFYLNNPALTFVSMLIDKFAIPFIFAFVVGCYLLAKTKLSYILDYFKLSEIKSQLKKLDKKLIVAFFSLLLTIASVQFVKLVYPQDRPCATDLYLEKIACPSSSTFPSTHTATAATFAAFSIGTPIFIPAFIFYLIVAFSRMFLGLHYFVDVLVASAFGFASYFLVDSFLDSTKKRIASKSSNVFRGFLHIFFGLFIMFIITLSYWYVNYPLLVSMSIILLVAFVLIFLLHLDKSGKRNDIIHEIIDFVSMRDRFPGESAIWFCLGAVILIGFTQDVVKSIAGIYVVTIGDVASAAFSSKPNKKSFFKNKNVLSYSAFVVSSLPALILLGWEGLPIILLAALIESMDLKINDNFILFLFLTLALCLV